MTAQSLRCLGLHLEYTNWPLFKLNQGNRSENVQKKIVKIASILAPPGAIASILAPPGAFMSNFSIIITTIHSTKTSAYDQLVLALISSTVEPAMSSQPPMGGELVIPQNGILYANKPPMSSHLR